MRKQIKVSLLLLGATFLAQADHVGQYTGQTFLSVRPQWQTGSAERRSNFRTDRAHLRCDGWDGAMQVAVFGGASTRTKDLAEYFGYCHKGSEDAPLVVNSNSGSPQANADRDVNPAHFGLLANDGGYSSEIYFQPRRSVVGGGFEWRQFFGWNDCEPKQWFMDVGFPVTRVRTKMRLVEQNVAGTASGAGDTPTNMVEAFTGNKNVVGDQKMRFGRINDEDRSATTKTGVDFLEFKIGREYVNCENYHVDGFVGFVAPTGNRPDAEYVFEAIVGNNKHWGFLTGGSMGIQFWEDCGRTLSWEWVTAGRYLFSGKETRSFDLKDRPWSRYMLVYEDANAAANAELSPGINTFTREFNVKPHWQFSVLTSLVYESCGFTGELGWNVWGRQSESVRLQEDWVAGPAVANVENDNAVTALRINRLSNIGDNNLSVDAEDCPNTAVNEPGGLCYTEGLAIRAQDIDYRSVIAPAALTNTIYASAAYNWYDACYPTFVALGGSYEFSTFNSMTSRWLAWGKLGVSI